MNGRGGLEPAPEEWADYIQGKCTAEHAQQLETLLLEDDSALSLYMQVMDSLEPSLPRLEHKEQFMQSVMEGLDPLSLSAANNSLREGARRRWYEHRMFHYTVAACITLIFLSAGWFDKLTPGQLQGNEHDNKGSYSQELVKVTTGWLDRLKP